MSSPDITIEDINLQIQKLIEDKVLIILTLRNNSKTLVYYMLKRPRHIDYDQGSQTLSVGLFEKELRQDKQISSWASEPEQVAILPDTTIQWQYSYPVWIKKIMRPPGSREIVEVSNIYDVQKVVCTVAYHSNPFRVKPFDEGEEVLVALSKWGETVSASFERKLINR
jgi:hypothetical protein